MVKTLRQEEKKTHSRFTDRHTWTSTDFKSHTHTHSDLVQMGWASQASPEERVTVAPTDFGLRTVCDPPPPSTPSPCCPSGRRAASHSAAVCRRLPQNIRLTPGLRTHSKIMLRKQELTHLVLDSLFLRYRCYLSAAGDWNWFLLSDESKLNHFRVVTSLLCLFLRISLSSNISLGKQSIFLVFTLQISFTTTAEIRNSNHHDFKKIWLLLYL